MGRAVFIMESGGMRLRAASALALFMALAGLAGTLLAAEAPGVTNALSNAIVNATDEGIANTAELSESEKFRIKKPTYEYRSGEARDPFFPLTKVVIEKGTEGGRQKTPFEMYDISQIKLLAIVHDAKGGYALMGLPDGKFYTAREGMLIGLRSGVIKRISPDHLMILEQVRDPKGKLKPQEVFIKLREEAGK